MVQQALCKLIEAAAELGLWKQVHYVMNIVNYVQMLPSTCFGIAYIQAKQGTSTLVMTWLRKSFHIWLKHHSLPIKHHSR